MYILLLSIAESMKMFMTSQQNMMKTKCKINETLLTSFENHSSHAVPKSSRKRPNVIPELPKICPMHVRITFMYRNKMPSYHAHNALCLIGIAVC